MARAISARDGADGGRASTSTGPRDGWRRAERGAKERGLAGAVRPRQAQRLARHERQVDPLRHGAPAMAHGEAPGLDRRGERAERDLGRQEGRPDRQAGGREPVEAPAH